MDELTPQAISILGPFGILIAIAVREYFGSKRADKTKDIYEAKLKDFATKDLCNERHDTLKILLDTIQEQSRALNNDLKHINEKMSEMNSNFESQLAGINSSLSLLVKDYIKEK